MDSQYSGMPQVDYSKLTELEISMLKLADDQRKKERIYELFEWAKNDYGVDLQEKAKRSKNRHAKQKYNIKSEVDFMFLAKSEKFHDRRNEMAALKIQSLYRRFEQRVKYLKVRDFIIWKVISIQKVVKGRIQRKVYLRMLAKQYHDAAVTV